MAISRENIYAACFTQLQQLAQIILSTVPVPLFSRRFKHWSQVPINLMPACYMQQYEETADQQSNMGLTRWHSLVNMWFYFSAENYNALPDQTYNAIVDALEGAFKPSPVTGRQTLNDTVTHAWVDGKVLYSDGALDRKAVILAQIHLLWSGK